jgi:hypothetical protein
MSHICVSCGNALHCHMGFLQCTNPMCRRYKLKEFTLNIETYKIK